MMNLQQLLEQFFTELNYIEQEAQQIKCSICNLDKFEAYSYWNYLTDGTMELKMNSLKEQFPSLHSQGLALIFLYFDSNFDGKLDYEDFFQLVVPIDNLTIRQEVTFRQVDLKNSILMQFNNKIEELLQFYGEKLKHIHQLKLLIHQSTMFNVYLTYQQFNKKEQNVLQIQRFAYFLITKEILQSDDNSLNFQNFYKLFSVYEDNPINEYYNLMNKSPFTIADKVYSNLRNIKVNNNKKKYLLTEKIPKLKTESEQQPRNTQYFSVQTSKSNQSKIQESIIITQWNI